MKTIRQEGQQKIRRSAPETLLVYDQSTETLIGRIVDMSAKGMKLTGDQQSAVGRIYYARIPLKKKIEGCEEIFIDAECRWCKKCPETGKYLSGFLLRFSSSKDSAAVQKIIYSWMATHAQKQNARYLVQTR